MKEFSTKEALGFGWNTFKKNALFLIAVLLLTTVIYGILNTIIGSAAHVERANILLVIILRIIDLIIETVLSLGLLKIAIKLAEGKKPQFSDLYTEYPKTLKYLAAGILVGLAVGLLPLILIVIGKAAGTSLLVIVGYIAFLISFIFIGLRLMFYSYVIVDKNVGIIASIKKSYKMTDGQVPNLFVFTLATVGVALLGVIALIVGLLAAVPVIMVATAFVYKKLESQTK